MENLQEFLQEITSHYDKVGEECFVQEILNHNTPSNITSALSEVAHRAKIIVASESLMPLCIVTSFLMDADEV